MLKSFSADWYKLNKSAAFRICCLLFVVYGVVVVLLTKSYEIIFPALLTDNLNTLLVSIFVSIFVASEFAQGTIKNSLSRGTTRLAVVGSKLLICAIATVIMTLISLVAVVITGTIVSAGQDLPDTITFISISRLVLLQLLARLSFAMLFTFLSFLMGTTGGAIAVNMICTTMVPVLLSAITLLLKLQVNLSHYFIGGTSGLITSFAPEQDQITQFVLVASVWAIVSIVGAGMVFHRQDVK